MTVGEITFSIVSFLVTNLPFVIFYFIIGFGPGLIIGINIANWLVGTGLTFMETHEQNVKKAAEHNAQWHPSHSRWQK